MLSKILKITTPIVLILIILFIGYNSYQQATQNTQNPLAAIPVNAAIIIKCNDAHKLYEYLEDSPIWQHLKNIQLLNDASEEIKQISTFFQKNEFLANNSLFVSWHKYGIDQGGILLSTSYDPNAQDTKKIFDAIGTTNDQYTYDHKEIQIITTEKTTLFATLLEGLLIASSSKILVEDAIRQYTSTAKLLNNTDFQQVYTTISNRYDINILYNINHLIEYATLLAKNKIVHEDLKQFSTWYAADIDLNKYNITASGFGAMNNNIHNYTDVFVAQKAKTPNIASIVPESTSFLLALNFSDVAQLYTNKNKLLQQHNHYYSWEKEKKHLTHTYDFNYDEFAQQLDDEAGIFYTSSKHQENQYAYLKSKNSILTIGMMQGIISKDEAIEYNNHVISKVTAPQTVAHLLGNTLNIKSTDFLVIIDDYFIFSSNQSSLKYLIDNYYSNNTLANNKYYQNFRVQIPNTSNLYLYINPGKYVTSATDKLTTQWKNKLAFPLDSLEKFTGFSLQLSNQKSLLYNNAILYYDPSFVEQLAEKWYIQLDTATDYTPQIIYNHFSKQQEILLQDKAHKIYLYTTDGILHWSKQITAPIVGKVTQVDYYKNGKLQLLFNTKNQLYMIDRLGNFVENYPIDLPTTTNLSHALFDYNNTKKYRILIVGEDNKIYNLDKKGKKINGWKYVKNNNRIQQTPHHFRVGNKDYILAERNNSNTQLLAINGSERVKFEAGTQFNDNPIQKDKNGTLYAITTEGKLWRGTLDGNSSTTILPELNSNSKLLCAKIVKDKVLSDPNSYNLIYSNNSQLYIIDVLDFKSIYNFSLDSEITNIQKSERYLSVTTKNKLYLYDTYGLVDGFPIDSDGYFNMADIDNNSKVNLINCKNGFIYNYEL